MSLNVVENCGGNIRVKWSGVLVLFIGLFCTAGLFPAIGMWWIMDSVNAAGTALAVGFSMACCTLPMLVIQQLRLPIERIPQR